MSDIAKSAGGTAVGKPAGSPAHNKAPLLTRLRADMRKYWMMYLMLLPALGIYLLFSYGPMYGLIISFKEYAPRRGILGSPWAANFGFEHFISFFQGTFFTRLMRNTFLISFFNMLWGFPAPILLALLLNEIKAKPFKRVVQTFTYLPYFISTVIICGMLKEFLGSTGIFNDIAAFFGATTRTNFLGDALNFRTIFVASDIWQGVGWGSILYLAALTAVDPQLYEAAVIDGAGRLRQTWNVTLPSIAPTITIMLILRVGALLSVGYEKIILLYSPSTYETADVISSYVYRRGIAESNFSFATAVGFFSSIINFIMVVSANAISRRVSDTSLW